MIENGKKNMVLLIKLLFFCGITFATVWAIDSYPEDVEKSKRAFLISGASYDTLLKDKKGAVTLCFIDKGGSYAHTALVFEFFLPRSPQEVAPRLVHYGQRDDFFGAAGFAVRIEGTGATLAKLYRRRKVCAWSQQITELNPLYTKYATWYVSNETIINVLKQAEVDEKNQSKQGNPHRYAAKLMRDMGFTGTEFGWWWETSDNLKILANDYIKPKYDKKF